MSQINSNTKDDFQVVFLLSCFVGHPVFVHTVITNPFKVTEPGVNRSVHKVKGFQRVIMSRKVKLTFVVLFPYCRCTSHICTIELFGPWNSWNNLFTSKKKVFLNHFMFSKPILLRPCHLNVLFYSTLIGVQVYDKGCPNKHGNSVTNSISSF